jgi:hypothetical protein
MQIRVLLNTDVLPFLVNRPEGIPHEQWKVITHEDLRRFVRRRQEANGEKVTLPERDRFLGSRY